MIVSQYVFNKPAPIRPAKPLLKTGAVSIDYRQYADLLEAWEENMKTYHADCEKHKQESDALRMRFKQDLFIYLGIESHPKREKIWDRAWENGRSDGLQNVFVIAQELTELIN